VIPIQQALFIDAVVQTKNLLRGAPRPIPPSSSFVRCVRAFVVGRALSSIIAIRREAEGAAVPFGDAVHAIAQKKYRGANGSLAKRGSFLGCHRANKKHAARCAQAYPTKTNNTCRRRGDPCVRFKRFYTRTREVRLRAQSIGCAGSSRRAHSATIGSWRSRKAPWGGRAPPGRALLEHQEIATRRFRGRWPPHFSVRWGGANSKGSSVVIAAGTQLQWVVPERRARIPRCIP
jgi:hypothetical protein